MKLSPIAVSRLADRIDDYVAQSLFMRDIVLDEVSKALVLAILKACGQFLDLAVAFLEAGAQPVPADLFSFVIGPLTMTWPVFMSISMSSG
jgi:hypothetical protein